MRAQHEVDRRTGAVAEVQPDAGAELEPARDAAARDGSEQRAFDVEAARREPQRALEAGQPAMADLEPTRGDADGGAGLILDRDAAAEREGEPARRSPARRHAHACVLVVRIRPAR